MLLTITQYLTGTVSRYFCKGCHSRLHGNDKNLSYCKRGALVFSSFKPQPNLIVYEFQSCCVVVETQHLASLRCCTHDIAYLHWFKQHHVVCVETQNIASLRLLP